MTLCSQGHEDVYHEGYRCPACDALDKLGVAKKRIEELEDRLMRMKGEEVE